MRHDAVVYQKTQFGLTGVLIVVAIMVFVYLMAVLTDEPRFMFIAIEAFLVVVILPFLTMTIRVTPTTLEWWFTLGFMRQRRMLADIVQVGTWQASFMSGFGYRVSETGALWRVSGSRAVLFDLVDGKRLALGTDEPERLIAAVKPLLPASPSTSSGIRGSR